MSSEQPVADSWARREARKLPPDWYELWMERAAIREYDGKQSPESADIAALQEIRRMMMERNGN